MRVLLLLALTGCLRPVPTEPSTGVDVTSSSPAPLSLTPVVDAAREAHVRADVLPGAASLRERVDSEPPEGLTALPPLERFIALQLRTSGEDGLPGPAVVEAYGAALDELPADWWGMHGALDSPAALRLRALPGADALLLDRLASTRPLTYIEEDEANTEAADWELTVADLAAEFLALRHAIPFDADEEDPGERAAARSRVAAAVRTGPPR